jgi:hypothetical protein
MPVVVIEWVNPRMHMNRYLSVIFLFAGEKNAGERLASFH